MNQCSKSWKSVIMRIWNERMEKKKGWKKLLLLIFCIISVVAVQWPVICLRQISKILSPKKRGVRNWTKYFRFQDASETIWGIKKNPKTQISIPKRNVQKIAMFFLNRKISVTLLIFYSLTFPSPLKNRDRKKAL